MKERLRKLLGVDERELGPVVLLLLISFLMGLFVATVTVAAQTQFLKYFDEGKDLPMALVISGAFGLVATALYTFLQGRISFNVLAVGSLLIIIAITAGIEFGEAYIHDYFEDANFVHFIAFTQILPFVFITQLIFWGSFGRLFNLRQAKRVIGSVDIGVDIASVIAFFSIPILLTSGVGLDSLYTIALASVTGYLLLYLVLSSRYLTEETMNKSDVGDETKLSRLGVGAFLRNKYIVALSMFVVVSICALRFVDYSFFNVATVRFDPQSNDLANFLSSFEATIVIFSILVGTFATDRITADYGLRVSLIINPLLLILFTLGALGLGLTFGYAAEAGESAIFFFLMIAMSKLFVNSLKGALDDPVFKMYYIPIKKSIKLDSQTKIEGMVTAFATMVAGGLIVLINLFEATNLLSITMFTVPLLVLWYLVTNRMYNGYKHTLEESLHTSRKSIDDHSRKEYTMDSVLEKEVKSDAENKVIYGLKLMEKLEPALFESSLLRLAQSELRRVKQFAESKIAELGFGQEPDEMKGLALQAAGDADASDLLSISSEKLMKLSKSVKQTDRILAAKLLRKLVSQKTIFILLELLRDQDPKVRGEALLTARRVKRPETWPVLIELISSPAYSHQSISALKEAGEPALAVLEGAFHKSGQSDLVMMKIIQIMGHIGGQAGLELLWKKVDYPDKRIVKQILYSLRYINYRAKGREVVAVKDLLDTEMSKTMWNIAALDELPEEPHFVYLRQALEEEIRENYDQMTLLLSLLYEPQSVQLVRENILAATPDSIQYALELLDLFVDADLKPKLIPLLDDTRTSEKLEKLQVYFPRESYNPVQVINYILNRDFNFNNRWSKVCAVHASAYLPDFRVSRGLISQVFNQDKLLQETSAWVIFNKDKTVYQTITERIPQRDKRFLDSSIQNNQLLDGLDDGFFLAIEMVLFIKQLPPFKDIPGNLLSDLTDKINPLDLNARDKAVFAAGEDAPILIVAHGEVILKNGEEEVTRLKKGAVFGDLFQEGPVPAITSAVAVERSIVFKISLHDFYFVLAKHHDLVQGIIRNVTGRKELISE
jgi:AAA family ATP:ADP antiporter